MVRLARMIWVTGIGVLCLGESVRAGEIHRAIQAGHLDRVKAVVTADPTTIEQPDTDTSLPLQLAVLGGQVTIVEWLVTHGATVEWKGSLLDWSALHLAALTGHVDVIRVLVTHGAAVDVRGRVLLGEERVADVTPLHMAAAYGHDGAVTELLARGASPNARTSRGRTPLYFAARGISRDELEAGLRTLGPEGAGLALASRSVQLGMGHLAACALLLTHGADVNARDDYGWTPLSVAAAAGHLDVVTYLLDHGADLQRQDDQGFKPLHAAAERGRADVTRLLTARGAVVYARTLGDGRTALQMAVEQGDSATVEALLGANADPNEKLRRGWTPLHLAVVMGHPGATAALVAHGARVNAADDDGGTPLHALAQWRMLVRKTSSFAAGTDDETRETVHLLVRSGADVNTRVPPGRTALDLATRNGDALIVEVLLANGADGTVRDPDGFTPLHVAADHGNVAIVELLLHEARVRAFINTPVRDGRMPLHLAAQGAFPTPDPPGTPTPDYPRVIAVLSAAGADPNARTNTGETPLDLAVRFGRSDAAHVLRVPTLPSVAVAALPPLVSWEQHMEAGHRAVAEHRDTAAETAWRAALADAERLGADDPHVFAPLDQLGALYARTGRLEEAAPVLQRALALRQQILGADDPDVAASLEAYATVLRKLGRTAEAEPLETRARAIRAKSQ